MENGTILHLTILVLLFVWLLGSQHKEQEDGESRKAQSHFLDLVVAMQLNTPSSIIYSVWIVMAFICAEATRQQIGHYHLSQHYFWTVSLQTHRQRQFTSGHGHAKWVRGKLSSVFLQRRRRQWKREKANRKKYAWKKHLQSPTKKNSLVIYGNTLSWHLTSVIVMKITSESKDKPKGHAQREKNVLFGCFCLCFKKRNEIHATATSLLPAWELQVSENAFSLSHMLRKVNFIE